MTLKTRTLHNTGSPLCAPSGALLAGVLVTFELLAADGTHAEAWDGETFEHVMGMVTARTDANGEFTVDLWPNNRGTEITYYKCTLSLPPDYPSFTGYVEDIDLPITWAQFMATQIPVTPGELSQLATYVQQIEDARAQATAAAAAAQTVFAGLGGVNVAVLAGDVVLAADSPAYQFLDPNGATRAVTLPSTGLQAPRGFTIKHTGSAGYVRVNKPDGTQLGMLILPGYAVTCIWTGTAWEVL